ncbi:15926_t:CDS:2 [Dentiscutata heterogama]|uniref:15926_t:CDS:1 n=1 Tax=Dentiscutata heterogama TaxID=1316150 RepID=A0ACA9KN17_9GLOM|nr:15926_t:CDS:2 [Dentiscutata heterogama]
MSVIDASKRLRRALDQILIEDSSRAPYKSFESYGNHPPFMVYSVLPKRLSTFKTNNQQDIVWLNSPELIQ